MTGAAAAEFRLLGIMKGAEQPPAMSLYSQGSICPPSVFDNKRNRQEEDAKNSLIGEFRTPKRQFLERATDDDCDASRRLMERLLDVPAASVIPEHLRAATQETFHSNASAHSSTASSLYSTSSILSDMQKQGSLHQLRSHPVESAAAAPTISSAPYYGHGSLQQQFQSHHTSSAAAPHTRTSIFGMQEFGSYRPPTQRVSSSYPQSLPYQRDINVQDVTNALRDAQQLEDLANSQRARARALASALQHQTGYNGPR